MASLSSNRNYLVTVVKGATSSPGAAPGGNMVTANAMTKLNVAIENHWVNILEALGLSSDSGGIGGIPGKILNGAQLATGNYFLPNIFTTHVWRGSSGVTLSLQMRFDAWSDPVQDVLAPVQRLLAMFAPLRGGGGAVSQDGAALISGFNAATGLNLSTSTIGNWVLHPPGPTPYEYQQNDKSNSFTVSLGNVMIITDLIPTRLDWEFEERWDRNGNPMAAMLNVGFLTYNIPDATQILGWFRNQVVTSAIGSTATTPATGGAGASAPSTGAGTVSTGAPAQSGNGFPGGVVPTESSVGLAGGSS